MVKSRTDWRLATLSGEKGGGAAAAALMLLTWACWKEAYVHGVVATRGTRSEWTAGMPIDSSS